METNLDHRVCDLLKSFGILCYAVSGNVRMKDLGIQIDDPTEVIEFDALAAYENVGLIIETTTQDGGNKKKIADFHHKARLFMEAHNSGRLNLDALLLRRPARSKLGGVKSWKCVYVGTSDELLKKQLVAPKFPDSQDLLVINLENLAYLQFLSDRLGKFGRNELFEQMGITPEDRESPSRYADYEAICLENKKISGNIRADLFLFQAPALDLLNFSRVPRYGSLKPGIPESGGGEYQRLLEKKKLEGIASTIKSAGGDHSFPNAITVVLSDDVTASKSSKSPMKLSIPNRYGSVGVIDGQHRLFGYAHAGLSDAKLCKSKIPVVGLRLRGKASRRDRDSASIFFEINREQTNVPNELLYLLSYPVLGETTPTALAAHLISRLNTAENGPLQNVFSTRPFITRNRSGGSPVKIVMVANELARLFHAKDMNQITKTCNKISPAAWKAYSKKRPNKIIGETYQILDKYFRTVQGSFAEDWKSKDSMIFSSKYMMAFTRLFIEYAILGKTDAEIGRGIASLRRKLDRMTKSYPAGKLIFAKGSSVVPSIKADQKTVADFILKHGL